MAYQNTGFKRSMKVKITKTGSDGSITEVEYDGQQLLGNFPEIPNDDDFRRLERNGVDGDWDLRWNAFKEFLHDDLGETAYSQISNALNTDMLINMPGFTVKILASQSQYGGINIFARLYNSSNVVSVAQEQLAISYYDQNNSIITHTILVGASESNGRIVQSLEVYHNGSCTPQFGNYGNYFVTFNHI